MARQTAEPSVQQFIANTLAGDSVWCLQSESGTAFCESLEFEAEDGEPLMVLLYFSTAIGAQQAQAAHYSEFTVTQLSLFDFLYCWLPGMAADAILAGPDFSVDLAGVEVEPAELRSAIETRLSPAQSVKFEKIYADLKADRKSKA
jgi:Protein of unknown function (DUF2750)